MWGYVVQFCVVEGDGTGGALLVVNGRDAVRYELVPVPARDKRNRTNISDQIKATLPRINCMCLLPQKQG